MASLFQPIDKEVCQLAKQYPEKIKVLETFFDKETILYIDYANVRGTYYKRRWNVDLIRAKKLFDSFKNIRKVKFYYGIIRGDRSSQEINQIAKDNKYEVHTKQVKIIKIFFDISSIPLDSTRYIKEFIKQPLIQKLTVGDIQNINQILKRLNDTGIRYLEDKKCNFDVEIGMHMLEDSKNHLAENFVLWSSDSDFEYPIKTLIKSKRKVILFGTRKTIARELDALRPSLYVYYINGLRNLICRDNERNDLTNDD